MRHRLIEKIPLLRIDPPLIAASNRNPVTVEEFENLNGDLAAIVQPVTQLGRDEMAIG